MLSTLGGDGEAALRLVRQAQSRCRELTVIVPDQAKSAGTLFALGADHLYLGPTSDLGPIDPQIRHGDNQITAAKAIIAAVEEAERRVDAKPQTYPIHAAMLGGLSALTLQQARDAMARTKDQLHEALVCVQSRTECQIKEMAKTLQAPLIDDIQSHGTSISAQRAVDLGLPVKIANPQDGQWQAIWRLWTKYVTLNPVRAFEGRHASVIVLPTK